MPSTSPQHTVSTVITRVLIRYLEGKGHPGEGICDRAGIERGLPKDPEARLSADQFEALWREASRTVDTADFGLHFGRALAAAWPGGNLLFGLMMNCPTVAEAMDRLLKYHDIMADAIRPRMRTGQDRVIIYWDYFGPDLEMPPQLGDALLCLYRYMLKRLTEGSLSILEVRFTGPRPRSVDLHGRVFRAPLAFDQRRNELVLARDFLSLPIFMADGEMMAALEQHAQQLLDRLFSAKKLSNQVALLLGRRLVRGEPSSVEIVGKTLGMSPRSLQGKLKAEGTSYQRLLDAVREKLALSYLKKPGSAISEVAFLLGYADQSAFNHAFKRWTGQTPREYRRS